MLIVSPIPRPGPGALASQFHNLLAMPRCHAYICGCAAFNESNWVDFKAVGQLRAMLKKHHVF